MISGWLLLGLTLAEPRTTGAIDDEGPGRLGIVPRFELPSGAVYRAKAPKEVRLRRQERFAPVGDQGSLQASCVGWSVAYSAASYVAWDFLQEEHLSPAYLYGAVMVDGGNCLSGAMLSEGIASLIYDGVPLDRDFPYEAASCPRPVARSRVLRLYKNLVSVNDVTPEHKQSRKTKDDSIAEFRGALELDRPILVSAFVGPDFSGLMYKEDDYLWKDELFEADGDRQSHAMVVTAHRLGHACEGAVNPAAPPGAFRILSSWGDTWASNGQLWIHDCVLIDKIRRAYVLSPYGVALPPIQAKLGADLSIEVLESDRHWTFMLSGSVLSESREPFEIAIHLVFSEISSEGERPITRDPGHWTTRSPDDRLFARQRTGSQEAYVVPGTQIKGYAMSLPKSDLDSLVGVGVRAQLFRLATSNTYPRERMLYESEVMPMMDLLVSKTEEQS